MDTLIDSRAGDAQPQAFSSELSFASQPVGDLWKLCKGHKSQLHPHEW